MNNSKLVIIIFFLNVFLLSVLIKEFKPMENVVKINKTLSKKETNNHINNIDDIEQDDEKIEKNEEEDKNKEETLIIKTR